MKKIKLLLAICVVILFCSFAVADWVDLNSTAGRFTMKFPRKPEPQSQDVNSGGTHIKLHLFVYDASKYKDDNMAYAVMYCDYPEKMVSSDFRDEIVDTILKSSLEGMAGNMDAKLISTENSNYKDFPGKKAKLNIKDGQGYAYVKFYLVHSRMYMMEVICDPKSDHNASIDKFFDSFTILDSKTPAAKKPAGKK